MYEYHPDLPDMLDGKNFKKRDCPINILLICEVIFTFAQAFLIGKYAENALSYVRQRRNFTFALTVCCNCDSTEILLFKVQ